MESILKNCHYSHHTIDIITKKQIPTTQYSIFHLSVSFFHTDRVYSSVLTLQSMISTYIAHKIPHRRHYAHAIPSPSGNPNTKKSTHITPLTIPSVILWSTVLGLLKTASNRTKKILPVLLFGYNIMCYRCRWTLCIRIIYTIIRRIGRTVARAGIKRPWLKKNSWPVFGRFSEDSCVDCRLLRRANRNFFFTFICGMYPIRMIHTLYRALCFRRSVVLYFFAIFKFSFFFYY